MTDLGPSYIGKVLDPLRIGETLAGTLALGGVAYLVNASAASYTMQLWAFPLILLSVGALGPYLVSIVRQGLYGQTPLLGVRAAQAGVLGLTAAIGIAYVVANALPVPIVVGCVVVALALLTIDVRRSGSRDIRER